MFMIGPPVSVSPSPPPTRTATSSTPTASYTYDDTPPLRAAPTVMPFTAMRPSLLAPPLAEKNVIVGDSAMPLPSTVRPGVALSSAPAARDAGMAWMVSVLMTTSRLALWTSTTGVSPVTVIVSAMPPTRISAGMDNVWVPDSSMPPRLTVMKPASENVSSYVPARRSMMRYWPVPSVTTVRVFSMSTGLDASTVTPGSTPPDASRTAPVMTCARAVAGSSRRTMIARHFAAFRIAMFSSV
jgi:hypothetical protein